MYPWITRILDFCLQFCEKKCGLYMDVYGSCHFTDFHPSQINRFRLAGYKVILYLGTSNKKKIHYGSLTGQLYKLNTIEIQLMSTRLKLSFLESYKYKNNAKNTLN